MKIVFAHNVYDRFSTLKDTVQIEKKIFPDSKVCVAYNGNFINLFTDFNDIGFVGFSNEKRDRVAKVLNEMCRYKQFSTVWAWQASRCINECKIGLRGVWERISVNCYY